MLVLSITRITAFVPFAPQQQYHHQERCFALFSSDPNNDVSIPYDAAARLAYDSWLQEFNKGEFNPNRYPQFKENYEALTAANMAAKKKARDEGTGTVDLLTLNEFGDFSAEEYEAMQRGETVDTSASAAPAAPASAGSDIMGKAMESIESQAEASNALEEAAEALADEEEVSLFGIVFW